MKIRLDKMNEATQPDKGVQQDLYVSYPARGLSGKIRVPGDKSISHRALLVAALSGEPCEILGLSSGQDVINTARAIEILGARIERHGDCVVVSGGPENLSEPDQAIDLGNSGTGMRLIAGLVARFPFLTVLTGDESLSSRPMDAVAEPLEKMGAKISGRSGGRFAPLVVQGGELEGISFTPKTPSAQVKSAVLLAALGAKSKTVITETVATRTHTEDILALAGLDIKTTQTGAGRVIELSPGPVGSFNVNIPADPSQAAFWVVAASIVPDSEIEIENVYCGKDRIGYIDILTQMGANIRLTRPSRPIEGVRDSSHDNQGEIYNIEVSYSGGLSGIDISGDDITGLDEVPILALAGALAEGTTTFYKVGPLRSKETDRIATITSEFTKLGIDVRELAADSFSVAGGKISGGLVDSCGDHRIAMTCSIAGLVASGPVFVTGFGAVNTSYPSFRDHLRKLVYWK